MKIEYRVKRGRGAGSIHTPHRYDDGTYVVSKTRFEVDYVHVRTAEEILDYLDRGYRVRVSDPATGLSPGLVLKRSLKISKV